MEGILIVSIVFGGIVLALVVVGGIVLIAIKMFRGGLSRENRQQRADDARMIQEIYQGLSRMEQRVESLETILLDRQAQERKK